MRLLWFTDTLADVNGVSRFIRDIARIAHARGDDVTVVTSTRLPMPEMANGVNIEPRMASRMPGYGHLEIVWPRWGEMGRFAAAHKPDVIHVSTPGPVGLAGVLAARKLRVPLVGVYHTDFPAYIDRLLNDGALSWMCERVMRAFYGGFGRVLTRSGSYIDSVARLGVPRGRITPLKAGIDTSRFNTSFRDEGIWKALASRGVGGHKE
ncbi:MAG TPA: glycosyltransferase, partial [Phycisphaerales bacterium]|nr:glycosyltransferase [Phycisphaerales bacterium]